MIDTELLKSSIISIIVVLFSLTVHEVSHGYVSYLLGDDTAKRMGRLSLNPLKHLDPIGALCMFFFHFGWAKAVPINPNKYKNFRFGTVLVSLAGPVSNLVLAFLGSLVFVYLWDIKHIYSGLPIHFLEMLIVMNVGLAVFNFVPISPLDGSKILLAFLPERAYRFVLTYEHFGFIILLILTSFSFFGGFINAVEIPILNFFIRISEQLIL
ncbi:MAG: site-2 protease family protein [Clostridia bacterium]|nr:site-2 protease family protein [Clostridia bacterium]